MDISVIPPSLHKVPVSELLDYIVRRLIDWSREQGWCGALTSFALSSKVFC